MTIIVEDGTEVTDANSYVSVADCKIYLDLRGYLDWGNVDDATKDRSLFLAADYIERKYKLRWKGFSNSSTQSMTFPRTGIIDENGYTLLSTVIPQELIDAQCLLANLTVDEDGELVQLTTITTQDNLIKKIRDKTDVLEDEVEYFAPITQTFYQEVDDLLLPLTVSRINGEVVRG